MLLENLNIKPGQEQGQINAWVGRNRDLLAELLSNMGTTLGYSFGFTYLKEHGYFPKGQSDLEQSGTAVLSGWAEVLRGNRPLKMEITNLPSTSQSNDAREKLPANHE